MKYCPYCGVSLLGGAVFFCPECGKALRGRAQGTRRRRPADGQQVRKGRQGIHPQKNPMDENYDGYYDDVRPVDADQVEQRRDPELVKRIVCVVAGAIGIIALAIIVMVVL